MMMPHLAGIEFLGMLLVSLGAALITAAALILWRRREPARVHPGVSPPGPRIDLVLDDPISMDPIVGAPDPSGLERRLDDLARRVDRIAASRRRRKS